MLFKTNKKSLHVIFYFKCYEKKRYFKGIKSHDWIFGDLKYNDHIVFV